MLEDSPPLPKELGNPPKFELVVWGDDEKGIVGITGYEAEKDDPVLEKQWDFPDFAAP